MNVKSFVMISPIYILSLTSFSNIIIPPETPLILFDENHFGPFGGNDGEQTLSITYKYTGSKNMEKVYEILEGRYNGARVSENHTDYHTITKNGKYNANLIFYPTDFKEHETMDMLFQIISDKTHTVLYSNSFLMYRKEAMTIKPYLDNEVIYKSQKNIFSLSNSECLRESFNFTATDDVFANENYYNLDISNFKISYSSPLPFTYRSATLFYYDTKNIFPYLTKNKAGAVSFPLSITESNKNKLLFSFSGTYYVNPHTLEIATTKRKGFVQANRCYLPIGKKDEIEGDKFYISIQKAGANGSNIECELTYYSSNNLFGYCDDSDYCIKGGNI